MEIQCKRLSVNLMFHQKLFITLALLTLLTHYFCRLLSWNGAQQICLSHNNGLCHFDEEMGRDFSERVEADKVQTGDVFFVGLKKDHKVLYHASSIQYS